MPNRELAAMVASVLLSVFETSCASADSPRVRERSVDSPVSLSVSGGRLVDRSGKPLQLRGVNVSGLEFVAIQGWSPANPWGGQAGSATPDWGAMKRWKINSVRLPLNEASWLGYHCVDDVGRTRNPDPGNNYQETVKSAVQAASASGFYVIIDLHWTAPGRFCPLAQNPMADVDHSIAFWKSVAATFKDHPNVAFELFNEPFFFWMSAGSQPWKVLRDGGTFTKYAAGDHQRTAEYTWQSAGMQQLLDAVRMSGATNVVLAGAPSWSQDLSQWVAYAPEDPLKQLAAVWHAYPDSGVVGSPGAAVPKLGTSAYAWAERVLNAGIPLVISETGDHNAPHTAGAPFVSRILPWADAKHASYLGWGWNVWQNSDNVLIKDAAGTPSDGYGEYFRQHLICVDSGEQDCH